MRSTVLSFGAKIMPMFKIDPDFYCMKCGKKGTIKVRDNNDYYEGSSGQCMRCSQRYPLFLDYIDVRGEPFEEVNVPE